MIHVAILVVIFATSTSHGKRVQRSQKIKELRAKHFARVAADRARPLPKPLRSSTSRQSADVSRLKTRWIQACHEGQPSSGRASSASSTYHDKDQSGGTVRVNSPDGQIVPRMLDIDATSRSIFDRPEIGGSNDVEWMPSTAGVVQGFDARVWPPSQQQQKQQQQAMSSIHTPPRAPAVRSPCLESTQLASACESNGEALQARDVGQEYEGQLLGSECQPRQNPAAALRVADGTPLSGTRGTITDTTSDFDSVDDTSGISGYCNQIRMIGKDNPMRFFDSGIEVALDGSPVSGSITRYPQLMGTPTARSRVSSSGSAMKTFASTAGNDNFQPEEGGLPKFRKYVSRGEDTPPQEQSTVNRDDVGDASHDNSTCGEKSCLVSQRVTATRAVSEKQMDTECHQSTPDEGCVSIVDGHGPPQRLPPSHEESPAFKLLARNWGLFGGALDSSSVPNGVGVSTESSSPPGAALHTDFTNWEENCRTNSPIGRPCRNNTKLPIKTSPLQAEVNQPTRHVRSQAAVSDVSIEASTARNDSPELVMLWEPNGPSSEVDASCAGIAQPNQAMATGYSDRLAASQPLPSGAGNAAAYDPDLHLNVLASSTEVSEASPGLPTTLIINRKESGRTVDDTAWVASSSENPSKELKRSSPEKCPRESLGETSQRSRDKAKTFEAQSRGMVDHSHLRAASDGEKLEDGWKRQEGRSKRAPAGKHFEEHGHRSKRSTGDSRRPTKHKGTSNSEVQTPDAVKARLGLLCSSITRGKESPQVGTTFLGHGRRKEVPAESRSDGTARGNASNVLIAGKTTLSRRLVRNSRMLSDSLLRDIARTGDISASVEPLGARGKTHVHARS